ncbi:Tnp_DDE_dom domain-containing protein [Alphaproteobacteria bacterium]
MGEIIWPIKDPSEKLLDQDSLLITRLKKNMKNTLLPLQNKFLLYKRTIVETIFCKLKQFQRLWHSTFTSAENAFCSLMACLISYQLSPYKPAISTTIIL